jgi:hypothetical protein
MSGNIKGGYPKQRLLFFVAQDVNADIRDAVRSLVDGLASQGAWLIQPPMFVDTIDQAGTRDEDFPDETVGGALEIHSALDGTLPHDVDAATLAEVERLVAAAKELSSSLSLEIEFELDGVFVGAIEDGQIDKSLAEGLLGEWRRHLGLA